MTNTDLTLIGVLVDRSGSMASIKDDMEQGLHVFLESQREGSGTCNATLAQFDTDYEVVYGSTPVQDVARYRLFPRGGTALNDALGKFVTDIGAQLASAPEWLRPGKVVIVVVTDGYENSSREWTTAMVKDLVTQQQTLYKWEFVFLGKDINSFAVAGSFGIRRDTTLDFSNAPVAMAAMASNVSTYREAGAGAVMDSYTPEQRKAAVDEEEEGAE